MKARVGDSDGSTEQQFEGREACHCGGVHASVDLGVPGPCAGLRYCPSIRAGVSAQALDQRLSLAVETQVWDALRNVLI